MLAKRLVGAGAAIGAGAVLAFGGAAEATYYVYGVLYAKEGTTTVAEGKGSHGVDFGTNAAGGHIGSRDPRPGGSPAYGQIKIVWDLLPLPPYTTTLQSSNNSTSAWVDQAKYRTLLTGSSQAKTYARACQNDTAGPDACATSDTRNHKW